MNLRRPAYLLILGLVLASAPPTFALVLPGGKAKGESRKVDKASDCWVGLEVLDADVVASNKKNKVINKACPNQACSFDTQVCVNEPTKKCTTVPALTGITVDNSALVPPTDLSGAHACGTSGTLIVSAGSHLTVNVTASSASGGPDTDRFTFVCKKKPKRRPECKMPTGTTLVCNAGGSGSCPASAVPDAVCPPNTAGGPDEAIFTTLDQCTDLDNGWTGTSHNFPVPANSKLKLCLSGCDAAGTTPCTANGPTGAGSINTDTFGPPLPLVAAGVPVCVVNVFTAPATGTANIATGEMSGEVDLHSQVFITDQTKVCPRCETGTCDSGPRMGQACQVDGTVRVQNSLASNKLFKLSKGCPPPGSPLATLTIPLPITTGTDHTPGAGGSKPCTENLANGVPVADDGCSSSGCGTGNCTGNACVSMTPDPSDPSHMICVDLKGGLSQGCCNNDTSVPCFQTRPGSPGINRTGRPVPPVTVAGATGDFPKLSAGEVTVATFCIAATGSANIDVVTGLPGPGAVTFNNDLCLLKAP